MKNLQKFLKKCFAKGFTFLIVPSSGKSVKSWRLPFSVVLVIFTLVIFNIYVFVGFTTQIKQIYSFRQQIADQDHRISKLLKEQREVKPTLVKSKNFETQLSNLKKERDRLLSTFRSIQQKSNRGGSYANRGSTTRTRPYIVPEIPATDRVKTDLEVLKHNLSYLEVYLDEEAKEQRELLNSLIAYETLLDHTPSRWLVSTNSILSWFGWRLHPVYKTRKNHDGVDLEASLGSRVYAAADGVVSFAGYEGGYGWLVKVNHGYGYETRYGHLSRMLVSIGQKVKKGQLICLSGKSGVVTGPHLHYEVRINKKAVDPKPYLRHY